jgi:2,3-bisphosphoglycerate-dependent phosphoglycerate mutase
VAIQLVYETHAMTLDNEQGRATGWLPGQLSQRAGKRHDSWGAAAQTTGSPQCSAPRLSRATQTVAEAFGRSSIPVLLDWRLRECDYGQRNGMPVAELRAGRREHLDRPYPGGESWRQAVARIGRFLNDLPLRWQGQRVLVIGHAATRWGLDHLIGGISLEELIEQDFGWQEGWEYQFS